MQRKGVFCKFSTIMSRRLFGSVKQFYFSFILMIWSSCCFKTLPSNVRFRNQLYLIAVETKSPALVMPGEGAFPSLDNINICSLAYHSKVLFTFYQNISYFSINLQVSIIHWWPVLATEPASITNKTFGKDKRKRLTVLLPQDGIGIRRQLALFSVRPSPLLTYAPMFLYL